MSTIRMSEEINHNRRRFCGTAAMTIAAAQLGMTAFADAQSNNAKPAAATTIKPRTNTSFASLKQIDAKKFSGKYSHRIFKGIGHNVPEEAPQEFAKAVLDVDGY